MRIGGQTGVAACLPIAWTILTCSASTSTPTATCDSILRKVRISTGPQLDYALIPDGSSPFPPLPSCMFETSRECRDRLTTICNYLKSNSQLLSILMAEPTGLRAFFDCIALTGTRLGEALALKWKHIDLERRILRIEPSSMARTTCLAQDGCKRTKHTFRRALSEALKNHREKSSHRGPGDFVFCKRDGSTLDPDVLRKDFLYPILDRLGIPRRKGASGFHTFRHSAASIVSEQTGNLKLAQEFLGHSTIEMTAEIYTHTSAEAEREAAIALERAIYGDLFPVVPNIVG